jgi:hypothetical protein
MSFKYETLAGLKSLAKKIQAKHSVPRHQALEIAACHGGFSGYIDPKRKLPEKRPELFGVNVRQTWWGYESGDGGTANIAMRLRNCLPELVKAHHLTGYLGACSIKDGPSLERKGQQRHADEVRCYIGRIARTLQFMDATGLKPSHARKCYPESDVENRPPFADHDHAWFDPFERVHILSTEPYPSRLERDSPKQPAWELKHDWNTFYVEWGGIYGHTTKFVLCCPSHYSDTLKRKIDLLKLSPAALSDEEVIIDDS